MSTIARADVEVASRTTDLRAPSRWKFKDRCEYDDVATITCHDQESFEKLFRECSTVVETLDGYITLSQIEGNILPALKLEKCPKDLLDEACTQFRTPSSLLLPQEIEQPEIKRQENSEGEEEKGDDIPPQGMEGKQEENEENKLEEKSDVNIELEGVSIEGSVETTVSSVGEGTSHKRKKKKKIEVDEYVYTWDNFCRIMEKIYAPSYVYGEFLNRACARADMKTIEELIARGCNPNDIDGRGMTPVHYAAERGRYDVIKALGNLWPGGVNIDKRDHNGWTPFVTAASRGHTGTFQTLRSLGADVNSSTDMGRTGLHWAATKGHEGAVSALMKEKLDRNLQDKNGWTALHCAVINGDINIIRILLEGGVDPKISDKCGRKAKSYCGDDLLEMYEATIKKSRKFANTNKKKK